MRKSALLLFFMASICMVSARGQTPVDLPDTEWLSAAKAALKLATRLESVTFVVDDGLSSEARNALASLGKVVALVDVPDPSAAFFGLGFLRIFQFRLQGDRIEFLSGDVYPKVYQAGDCRFTAHFFLARTPGGEWKLDGPMGGQACVTAY